MNRAQAKKKVQEIVDNFELSPENAPVRDDYQRMHAAIQEATGMNLDNNSTWALVNRVKVDRVSFSLDD